MICLEKLKTKNSLHSRRTKGVESSNQTKTNKIPKININKKPITSLST
jgi:hypothetical protein